MRVGSTHIHNNMSTLNVGTQKTSASQGELSPFQKLFSGTITASSSTPNAAVAPAVAASTPAPIQPTFEQGATVVGPDGSTTALNPMEMASEATAEALAAKLGGTVTTDTFAGGYSTSAPTREISFANSNVKINAGVAATLFAEYGDAQGSEAWQIIDSDLGRPASATGPVS